MVQSCCAINCTQRFVKGSSISFHGFPKDILFSKKWLVAIRREHFKPTKYTKICSKHFVESDFIRQFGQIKLKCDAVPSVFDFPSHLVKLQPKKRLRRQRNVSPPIDNKEGIQNFSQASSSSLLSGGASSIEPEIPIPVAATTQKHIRKERRPAWYQSIDGSPGYTAEALRALALKVEDMAKA